MGVLQVALFGIGIGAVYALLGLSVTITRRAAGVINFAAAGIGAFGTFIFYHLHDNSGWPTVLALICGIAAAAVVGGGFHLVVMKQLGAASLATRVVATLGLMIGLIGVTNLLFAPTGSAISVNALLPSGTWHLGSLSLQQDSILIVPIALLVTVVLIVVQRRTRFGLAATAVAEDSFIAATFGVSPDTVGAVSWALGGVIATVGILLIAPIYALEAQSLTLLIVPALATALLARFESLPITLVCGLGLGVVQSEVSRYTSNPAWPTVIPMLVIVIALATAGSYIPQKTETTPRMPRVGPGRLRLALWAYAVAALLLIELLPGNWLAPLTISLIFAIVILSVVVVTGYAGQLSLVQLSLSGVGAFFFSALVLKTGIPVWLAVIIAPIGAVLVGLVVAMPAVRTRGLNLAVATLALANLIDAAVVTNPSVATYLDGAMRQLSIFGIQFDTLLHPKNFAILCAVLLALCVVAVTNLRRGASGRRILAARANERGSMALGISVPGAKLFAFGLGAFFAGLAGALLETQLSYADFTSFPLLGSIESTLNGVLGGAGWPSGAVVGGALSSGGVVSHAIGDLVAPNNWLSVITGVGAILVVMQSGDGLIPLWLGQLAALWRRLRVSKPGRRSLRGDRGAEAASELLGAPAPAHPERVRGKALSATNISVRFGTQDALAGVDIQLEPGEILGVIGPNGAGKTTLIDVLSGFCVPRTGSVTLDGDRIDKLRPHRRARLGLARSFQSLELFEDMTIAENIRAASEECSPLRYVADLLWPKTEPLSATALAAISGFELAGAVDRTPTNVDYATRRLVAMARAVAGSPSVLLLDEPAAGLDAPARRDLRALIERLARDWGMSVLLVEHDVDLVFAVSDRVLALNFGQVICSGTPDQVRTDPALAEAYLGTATATAETSPAPAASAHDADLDARAPALYGTSEELDL